MRSIKKKKKQNGNTLFSNVELYCPPPDIVVGGCNKATPSLHVCLSRIL